MRAVRRSSVICPSRRSVDGYSCRASEIQGGGDAEGMWGLFEPDLAKTGHDRSLHRGWSSTDLLRALHLRRERGRPPSSDGGHSGLHSFAWFQATSRHRNRPVPASEALHTGQRPVLGTPWTGIGWHRRETPREARRRCPKTFSTSRMVSLPWFEAIRPADRATLAPRESAVIAGFTVADTTRDVGSTLTLRYVGGWLSSATQLILLPTVAKSIPSRYRQC
ncbi:hypothetical protein EDD85DRAFT_540819 [Armillaria nabsnona]|nr:hypothetical protein EDD85DRAFT_540819 [Armillaria nabsnona]